MSNDKELKELKQIINDYRYCLNKMNGQIREYWLCCDYCHHDIYEYDPEREYAICEKCDNTTCVVGCTDFYKTHNCFTDNGWTNINDETLCGECSNL